MLNIYKFPNLLLLHLMPRDVFVIPNNTHRRMHDVYSDWFQLSMKYFDIFVILPWGVRYQEIDFRAHTQLSYLFSIGAEYFLWRNFYTNINIKCNLKILYVNLELERQYFSYIYLWDVNHSCNGSLKCFLKANALYLPLHAATSFQNVLKTIKCLYKNTFTCAHTHICVSFPLEFHNKEETKGILIKRNEKSLSVFCRISTNLHLQWTTEK